MDIKSILVVEDSPTMGAVLAEMARAQGVMDVVNCTSGEEALRLIEFEPYRFQLVLIDLAMPGMDGMELLNRISHSSYFGCVAIISAMDRKVIELAADIAREHKLHIVGALHKPFSEEEFNIVLSKARRVFEHQKEALDLVDKLTLDKVMAENRIQPYFQPIVNVLTGEIYAVEALARIQISGETNAILPPRFLPVLEAHQMLDRFTARFLQLALADFRLLQDKLSRPDICLSFNISPSQLGNLHFPDQFLTVVQRHQLDPGNIIIEITEDQPITALNQLENLNRYRIRGFDIALDDFGDGFTTLQQLRQIPFTHIKLSKKLVSSVHMDHLSQALVQAVVAIADEAEALVIAEGVENQSEVSWLSNQPRMYAQGFAISRPKPLQEILRWAEAWHNKMTIPLGENRSS